MTVEEAWKKFKSYRDTLRAKKFYVDKREFNYLYKQLNVSLSEVKAWQKQKIWQGQHAYIDFKENATRHQTPFIQRIREGQTDTSIEFINAMRAEGKFDVEKLRREQLYQMSLDTFQAASKARKILQGKGFSWKDRSKSTQELAALMEEEIMAYRQSQLAAGYSTTKANLAVSAYFFGS